MVNYMYLKALISPLLFAWLILSLVSFSEVDLFSYKNVASTTLHALAVSTNGEGVVFNVTLIVAYPGTGRVFFSALPYTEIDTQGAARLAAEIAASLVGKAFHNYDYYVTMDSRAPIIGGPSAGALITAGFMAVIAGRSIRNDTTITGMINPDGTIGPVGGLKEKIEAAASAGIKRVIIPRGQRMYTYPVVVEQQVGRWIIRRTVYNSIDLLDYGRSLGVEVIEAGNILEAFQLLSDYTIMQGNTVGVNPLTIRRIYDLRVVSNLISTINDVYADARSIGAVNIVHQITALNSTLNSILSLSDNYPTYTIVKVADLSYSVYQLDAYVKYYAKGYALEDYISELYEDISSRNLTSCTNAMWALSVSYLHLARTFYEVLLGYVNQSSIPLADVVSNYAIAKKYLALSDVFYELSKIQSCTSNYVGIPLSTSLAIYSYVNYLLNEMGVSQGPDTALSTIYSAVLSLPSEMTSLQEMLGAVLVSETLTDFQKSLASTLGVNVSEVIKARLSLVKYVVAFLNVSEFSIILQLVNESTTVGDSDVALYASSILLATFLYGNLYAGVNISTFPIASVPSFCCSGTDNSVNTWQNTSMITFILIIVVMLTVIVILLVIASRRSMKQRATPSLQTQNAPWGQHEISQ